jgi:hypothetical protein
MRAGPASRIDTVSASALESLHSGWLQAGLVSFAYRLAHLRAARPAVLGSLCLIFFFA